MTSPPIDPAYTRFLQGLHVVAANPVRDVNSRWQAYDQTWRSFDPRIWRMEYLGAPNTSPEAAVIGWGGLGNAVKTWTVWDNMVPTLFEQLQRAYATLHQAHPESRLVWAPLSGGTWTGAFEPGGGPHGDPGTLPKEALERIAKVHAFERIGDLTHEQAQKRIAEIIAEYT